MTDQGLHDTVMAIALIVMGLGLIGIVVPMIPGTILIFATSVAYAFIDGFRGVGWPTIIVLGLLTLVSMSAELWATGMGARKGGASGWSVMAGLIGGFVGLIVFTLPGAIIGAMLGVIVSEILRVGDLRKAFKAGGGWLAGWLLSSVLQVIIGLIMIAIFYWQARWPR